MKSIAKSLAALPRWAAVGAMMLGTGWAHAAKVNDLPGGPAVMQLNLHPPATQIAQSIDDLHWMIMIISTLLFLIVCVAMLISIIFHRKSRGAVPAKWHESVPIEVAWTAIPFLIVVLMAMPATKTIVAQKDTTNSDITVKATGYQWKWGYDYLTGEGAGISFLAELDPEQRALSNAGTPQGDDYLLRVDNPLVLPVDKKIRIITTANDVIHAWFVPSFGVKQDAIPGLVRDTWFRVDKTGDYYGQCAELCGKEHAYMPIHVKIVSQEEYSQWVQEQLGDKAASGSADADPATAKAQAQPGQQDEPGLAGPAASVAAKARIS
ncbi:MAG: cytochrome c oxidase subunit II [Ottowia sp.]|nr:cytochrome c oxidase subunit II [Ottowia sp.]